MGQKEKLWVEADFLSKNIIVVSTLINGEYFSGTLIHSERVNKCTWNILDPDLNDKFTFNLDTTLTQNKEPIDEQGKSPTNASYLIGMLDDILGPYIECLSPKSHIKSELIDIHDKNNEKDTTFMNKCDITNLSSYPFNNFNYDKENISFTPAALFRCTYYRNPAIIADFYHNYDYYANKIPLIQKANLQTPPQLNSLHHENREKPCINSNQHELYYGQNFIWPWPLPSKEQVSKKNHPKPRKYICVKCKTLKPATKHKQSNVSHTNEVISSSKQQTKNVKSCAYNEKITPLFNAMHSSNHTISRYDLNVLSVDPAVMTNVTSTCKIQTPFNVDTSITTRCDNKPTTRSSYCPLEIPLSPSRMNPVATESTETTLCSSRTGIGNCSKRIKPNTTTVVATTAHFKDNLLNRSWSRSNAENCGFKPCEEQSFKNAITDITDSRKVPKLRLKLNKIRRQNHEYPSAVTSKKFVVNQDHFDKNDEEGNTQLTIEDKIDLMNNPTLCDGVESEQNNNNNNCLIEKISKPRLKMILRVCGGTGGRKTPSVVTKTSPSDSSNIQRLDQKIKTFLSNLNDDSIDGFNDHKEAVNCSSFPTCSSQLYDGGGEECINNNNKSKVPKNYTTWCNSHVILPRGNDNLLQQYKLNKKDESSPAFPAHADYAFTVQNELNNHTGLGTPCYPEDDSEDEFDSKPLMIDVPDAHQILPQHSPDARSPFNLKTKDDPISINNVLISLLNKSRVQAPPVTFVQTPLSNTPSNTISTMPSLKYSQRGRKLTKVTPYTSSTASNNNPNSSDVRHHNQDHPNSFSCLRRGSKKKGRTYFKAGAKNCSGKTRHRRHYKEQPLLFSSTSRSRLVSLDFSNEQKMLQKLDYRPPPDQQLQHSSGRVTCLCKGTLRNVTSITSPKIATLTLSLGHIVWGKIQGYPWWPAKILEFRTLHVFKMEQEGEILRRRKQSRPRDSSAPFNTPTTMQNNEAPNQTRDNSSTPTANTSCKICVTKCLLSWYGENEPPLISEVSLKEVLPYAEYFDRYANSLGMAPPPTLTPIIQSSNTPKIEKTFKTKSKTTFLPSVAAASRTFSAVCENRETLANMQTSFRAALHQATLDYNRLISSTPKIS